MSSPGTTSVKGKSVVLCQAATSFKKKSGQLVLTKTHLVWNQSGPSVQQNELSFINARLNSLFMSKEGGVKVVLKVNILDLPGGSTEESYNFTFTSGPSAVSDREHFKREISHIISRNRAGQAITTASPPQGSLATLVGNKPVGPYNGLPTPAEAAAAAAAAPSSKLPSVRSSATESVAANQLDGRAGSSDPNKDWQVRQRLLKKNPEMNALHVDLVRSGMMTEEEFWEGREYMLLAESVATSQISGRSAQIVDPRPEQTESGDIKIKLSQQLIKDIFDQYPIVAKVYNDNVPEPLAEAEFWHRYFHSKLFERHRSSGRSALAGGSGAVKDDPIFDKYLEDPDDDLEPKNMRGDDVYRLLDLAATEEDHGETGNAKDFTMRAGSQKKSLPLMRRFNEHSERLLTQALGATNQNRNLGHLTGGDAGARRYYDDIVLEDLQGDEREEAIPLNVGDQSDAYFGAASSAAADSIDKENFKRKLSDQEVIEIWDDHRKRLRTWHPDLSRFHFSRSSAKHALISLQSNISQRLSTSSASINSKLFPENTLRAMISCQASANEFLRHFWSAVLPARSDDISASAMATPLQKAGKAQRMVGYLEKTQERVDTVVRDAEQAGLDPTAIREALEPCMGAVRKACEYFYSRVKGK